MRLYSLTFYTEMKQNDCIESIGKYRVSKSGSLPSPDKIFLPEFFTFISIAFVRASNIAGIYGQLLLLYISRTKL